MNINKPKRPPKPTKWSVSVDISHDFNPEDNYQIWNKLAIQLAQNILKDGGFNKIIESYPGKPNKFILSHEIKPTYTIGINPYKLIMPNYEKITYIDPVIN